MQPAPGPGAGVAAHNSRFAVARRKPEAGEAGPDGMAVDAAALSDETKRRVEAAKSYIENMYKVQYQNIQERYAR
jgi:serine/threonine kinase 38